MEPVGKGYFGAGRFGRHHVPLPFLLHFILPLIYHLFPTIPRPPPLVWLSFTLLLLCSFYFFLFFLLSPFRGVSA